MRFEPGGGHGHSSHLSRSSKIYRVSFWPSCVANVPGSIECSVPTEFLGKSGAGTPEDFFVPAVITCFLSPFSSIANLSNFDFTSLDVEAEGCLERVEDAWRLVRIALHPDLRIVREADRERAIRLLEKAEKRMPDGTFDLRANRHRAERSDRFARRCHCAGRVAAPISPAAAYSLAREFAHEFL